MKYSDRNESGRGIVAISNLFPNEFEPRRGLFNLRQFKAMSQLAPLSAVAPIAHFPMPGLLASRASSGRVRDLPSRGRIDELDVRYPRYFYPPKIGRPVQGHLYYMGVRRAVKQAVNDVNAFALFGTWAYPDGFAVVKLARELGMPCAIKVHGSDINEYMDIGWRRKVIVATLNQSSKVIAVSEALKRRMVDCGVNKDNIIVVYNGVDRSVFKKKDKSEARSRLGLSGSAKRILFVGNMKPVKGLDDLIEAMRQLVVERSSTQLHIVGYGPLEPALRRRVNEVSLQHNVHFEGEKAEEEVALWMNACDLLCLPSLNEGVPNVVLEALSCGLPVVATTVGGIPEVVSSDVAGILVEPRDPVMLYATISHALEHEWTSAAVSRFGEQFSWESNAETVYASLQEAGQ